MKYKKIKFLCNNDDKPKFNFNKMGDDLSKLIFFIVFFTTITLGFGSVNKDEIFTKEMSNYLQYKD